MKAKEKLPRIIKILAVEPFKIEALWSTAEVRSVDFALLFKQWQASNDTRLYPLMDYTIFKNVEVSENRTLIWPDVLITVHVRNRTITSPLDLDPDELYRSSTLVSKTEPVPVGAIIRKARIDAGLSQAEVAYKSGTSRNYISRIENGKSDIQLETLNKIVQLGIGKRVELIIS